MFFFYNLENIILNNEKMREKLNNLKTEFIEKLAIISNESDLEILNKDYLGKN